MIAFVLSGGGSLGPAIEMGADTIGDVDLGARSHRNRYIRWLPALDPTEDVLSVLSSSQVPVPT